MSLESPARNKQEQSPESEEIKVRKYVLGKIESMTLEEFENAADSSNLSDSERKSLEHWRLRSETLDRVERGQEVRDMYFASKHPTMGAIFNKLGITTGSQSESAKFNEMDKMEEEFSYGDLEEAIQKMQIHLGQLG